MKGQSLREVMDLPRLHTTETKLQISTTFVFFDVIYCFNSYLKHLWSLDSTTQYLFHLSFKYFVAVIMRIPQQMNHCGCSIFLIIMGSGQICLFGGQGSAAGHVGS